MIDIDTAWSNYCNGDLSVCDNVNDLNNTQITPKCSSLYISTKTKISYLSHKVILNDVFWKIPIIPYHEPKEGIIKKQMKVNSNSEEDFNMLLENLNNERNKNYHIDEHIITRIVNEKGRIKYKDVRKISIGLHKKDIISFKCKKKGAFYNCFVVIIRIKHENTFKELHIKIFNTGKLEIPGIKDDELLVKALHILITTLSPFICDELHCCQDKTETVLINSNFNCGYFINREKLFKIIKTNYNIKSSYDACSYPGIQCQFFYNNDLTIQTGVKYNENDVKVSFMIFRTGSVLIVGKCTEQILNDIYIFVKNMLEEQYTSVYIPNTTDTLKDENKKEKKNRKKTILIAI
jgi:TATA-box binding protein (TBP) (component of TFIID and TFIIIB)